MDLTNLVDVGQMVAESALVRTESRGAHFRSDHPSSDTTWLKNVVLTPAGDAVTARCEAVRFTRLTPGGDSGAMIHGNDLRQR